MEDKIRYSYIDKFIRNTIKANTGLLKEIEQFAKERYIPIIQPEVARFLEVIGNIKKPERVLEIGTAIGYSTIILTSFTQPSGKVDTIDISEEMLRAAHKNIIKAGLMHKVNMILGDAADVLKCLTKKYDMIFLDASKGQYLEFFPECMRLLKNEGILISDNVLYRGLIAQEGTVVHKHRTIAYRLREYLNVLCSHPMLDTSIIPIGDGVALSYVRRKEDES